MKKIIITFIMLTLSTMFIGCAQNVSELKPAITGPVFSQIESPPKGHGGIYIFRPLFSDYLSKDIANISLNDSNALALPFGAYLYESLPAGKYSLSVSPVRDASALWNKTHEVEIKTGENVYVAIWANKDVSENLSVMLISPTLVVPSLSYTSKDQSVFIEVVNEDMAIPALSQCVSVIQ
ncbi:hypothetical protein [Amphritea pacifica]|uniref:hypothetical protein n=1 Tax=Amphritea pacifica TaxID=2811233 RepID=UPI0019623C89|nr:hypothetical protein [Amphritea pacifica]MBN1006338.1 hypothetical protein [Amphritea pacifica]